MLRAGRTCANVGPLLPHPVMDQHLTVKEAVNLTGKSESTIKRLIRDIVNQPDHPDRGFILPPQDEVERRRKAGEPYVWKIDRQLLLRRFPQEEAAEEGSRTVAAGGGDSHAAPIIEVLREQLQSKDRQIQTLETQLDRKDKQIENLNERMHESNILMNELQKRLAIAAPNPPAGASQPVDATHVETEEGSRPAASKARPKPSKPKSDSLWTRPLGQFFRRPQ